MRTTLIIRWCLAILCCTILNLSMEAQFQNTYNLPESHDHESVAPSVTNVDNHVVASTLTDLGTGDRSIHVMEVDNLGNIVWELEYNTPNQDRVFHIGACPQGAGYYLSGSTLQGGAQRLLVITINALGAITNQAIYNDAVFNANSYGLHILKTANDPQPGYVVAGFETVAPNINAQKEALIMKLDGALNVLWSRHLDTASGNLDYDMGSHVVEADGIGYFLSGSSNRPNQGDQVILAAMFEYNGNLMWENQYDDNGGNGHYSVGAGAYFDALTNEIYQLSNLSIIHHFGVNVFNVFTGVRNLPKSYGVFSNLGYYNIQAFRIMESQDPNNLVISGYMRDHNWNEDENGDGIPDAFYNGSVPFAMEVDKMATNIVWDNIYLVPATGYNTNVDIFSAFSAGQQPRILHTEIAWTKQDGAGYVLAAYRGNFPDFETELIELDLAGDNNCSKSEVELQFLARNWYDYQVLDISGQNNFRLGPNFTATPIASLVSACSVSGNPCTPDSNFSISDTGDCCYVFTDLTPGNVADQGCDLWELFDTGGALIASGNSDSFTHCFSISGTYTMCYTDCCVNDDGTVNQSQTCQNFDVVCCDAIVSVYAEQQGCYYTYTIVNTGGNPDAEVCVWTDLFGNVTLPYSWTIDFTGFCGPYGICYAAYCCDEGFDPNQTPTICADWYIDCCGNCTPDADFEWNAIGDCCYDFYDLTPDLGQPAACDYWDVYDSFGNLIANGSGDNFTYCFPYTGNYTICYNDCCVNANGTQSISTVCKNIEVDCGGPCELDANFSWVDLGDCCFKFYDLSPDPNQVYNCDYWEIYDLALNLVASGIGDEYIFCFPTSGTFLVCFHDCCMTADGTVYFDDICQEIYIDCGEPCAPDANFSWTELDGCCYEFIDLTPDPAAIDCDRWDILDQFGNVIASSSGDQFVFCFPGGGVYTVCYTDCCVNPDGTINIVQNCQTIEVVCCDPQVDILVEQQGCFYTYALVNTGGSPDAEVCVWTDLFGVVSLPFSWTQDFTGYCGLYGICYGTFCCSEQYDPAVNPTLCIDWYIDCCEPCTPDADFQWNQLQDCCYEFYDLTPAPAGQVTDCDNWEIFDISWNLLATSVGDNFIFCFPGTGSYVVCYTDCCINADGTVTTTTICKDIWVDCGGGPCVPDADFTWNDLGQCCYEFYDISPDPAANAGCDRWEIYDAFGNLIVNGLGENFIFCFPGTGSYVVCFTDCCINVDGTITIATICKDIWVDCGGGPCVPDADFAWNDLGQCCYEFYDISPDPAANAGCDRWEIYDAFGNLIVNGLGENFIFCFPGTGSYVVCFTDCCINVDGTITIATICKDIWVDCGGGPCVPDANFSWTELDGCCYEFTDLTPDPAVIDCDRWDILDQFGNVIASSSGDQFVFCFPGSGVYTVCYTDCCINPDGTINTIQNCQVIDVNCGCNQVPQFDWEYFPNLNGPYCDQGFCIFTPVDPSIYCATWDFGDGTVVNHPIDICPAHTYACDGVYTVCVTVYCCVDPSVSFTVCKDITVDCPCVLAANANFTVATNADNCSITAIIDLPLTPCPDELCWAWDFGDGTTQVGGAIVNHTYTASGIYSICLTVFCCDDPSIAYTICYEVEVDCGCQPVGNFTIDVFQQNNLCGEVGFCPNFIFDVSDYCAVWDFGDGTIIGPFVGADMLFCPIHTYDCAGIYNVCLTIYCCEDPSISTTVCTEVTVDCGCKLPSASFITASSVDCTATFNLGSTDDYCGDICVSWDFGDGNTGSGWSATHTYAASGVYTVCATVFCCNDPSEAYVICTQVVIECPPCTPDPTFTISTWVSYINGQCYVDLYADLLVHDAEQDVAGDQCDVWYIYDALGNLILTLDGSSYGNGWDIAYILPAGCYTICRVECCVNPDGTVNQAISCIDFCAECPCEAPQFDWDYFPNLSGDNCEQGFCISTLLDPNKYCAVWDFGDGTVEYLPVDICPVHTYTCDGVYDVCVTVFCCEDQSIGTTVCKQITVDCPCSIPADASFNWSYGQDMCTVFTNINLPAVTCPDELCWSWDFGDGTVQIGAAFASHTYTADGIYTVCLNIFCCDNPAMGYTICQEVQIDCGGCPEPCEIFPSFMPVAGECSVCFFNLSQAGSFTTITGYLWDFGDGNTSTSFDPVHTFPDTGTYTVCLTVYGSSADGNCEQTFCWDVTVDCDPPCPGDTNGDGVINTADLIIVLAGYGQSCP